MERGIMTPYGVAEALHFTVQALFKAPRTRVYMVSILSNQNTLLGTLD